MAGTIHWGRKVHIRTRQEAYYDVAVYEVPFTGRGDAELMRHALVGGKGKTYCLRYDKRPQPWTGACGDIRVTLVDDSRKVATVEVSHPIGD